MDEQNTGAQPTTQAEAEAAEQAEQVSTPGTEIANDSQEVEGDGLTHSTGDLSTQGVEGSDGTTGATTDAQ